MTELDPPRRLARTSQGRVLAGVAGGLGAYLRIDPVLVRVTFVGLTLLGGAGLLLYLIMWAVVPDEAGGEAIGERVLRRLSTAPAWVRIVLLVLATIIALDAIGPVAAAALALLLLVLVVVLLRDGRASESQVTR
jgi:phage shock protein PspC (stress-responsive transcriptional regulator)